MRSILAILLIFIQTASAQIPNSGFENWNNGYPDWWQTANIPIFPASIVPDSDSHAGQLSVKGIVVSDLSHHPFQPYLGIYGGGAQGFSISNPYNLLSGWCKLSLHAGDRFTGYVRMFNSNQETVAEGFIAIDSSFSSWKEFNVPVNYFSTDNPVSCTMFFTITDSTLLSAGHIGSYFLIDELSLTVTVGISAIPDDGISIKVNSSDRELTIDNFNNDGILNFSLFDITGKLVLNTKRYSHGEIISLINFNPGIYLLSVYSDDRRIVKKILLE
jgi:hypothetical protein